MKRMFLSALGVFALSLTINLSSNGISLSKEALADPECLDEEDSICGLDGRNYRDKYLCKDDSDEEDEE